MLQSILGEDAAPVLLIDEIDRADEAFEAFLLELLSDFQITVPEMGTIQAKHVPYVILTSNRSRELSDALKRRCLYHWIDYPESRKGNEDRPCQASWSRRGTRGSRSSSSFRRYDDLELAKPPGVAETLDCAQAATALGADRVDVETWSKR